MGQSSYHEESKKTQKVYKSLLGDLCTEHKHKMDGKLLESIKY